LPVETEAAIGLDARPSGVIQLIARFERSSRVALVGHNPTFSQAAEVLLLGTGQASGLELRTGEAAVLEIPDPGAPLAGGTLLEVLRMPEHGDKAS
jgi:phosphohistidine phosphatase SixA